MGTISAVSYRNDSITVIETAENFPAAQIELTIHVGDNILKIYALHAHN
jgi:hypothetical protein